MDDPPTAAGFTPPGLQGSGATPLAIVAGGTGTGTLELDGASAGADATALFSALFGKPALTLASARVQPAGAGAATFSGTVSDLFGGGGPVGVTGCLLDLTAPDTPTPRRHCILLLDLPAGFGLAALLKSYSSSPDDVASYLSGGRPGDGADDGSDDDDADQFSVFHSLDLTERTILFCSLDLPLDAVSRASVPTEIAPNLPSDVRAGLNFKVGGTFHDEVAALIQAVSLPVSFSWGAQIVGPPDEMKLIITADTAAVPHSVRLAPFDFVWTEASCAFALQAFGRTSPIVTLGGGIAVGGGGTVNMVVSLDLAGSTLKIATSSGIDLPSPADFAALIGLDDLDHLLPDNAGGYGGFRVASLGITMDLDPIEVREISFDLSTQEPVALIGGVVSVLPDLAVRITAPFGSRRAVRAVLIGIWTVGGSRFRTVLDFDTSSLYASLMSGQTLDGDALAGMLPGFQLPTSKTPLALADFEMSADYANKTFEAEVDIAGDWEIQIAGAGFGVSQLSGELSYAAGAVQDFALTGRLLLAGLWLDVGASYDGSAWAVRAAAAPGATISLTRIVDRLIADLGSIARHTADLPAGFLTDASGNDIAIKDLFVDHSTAGTGRTTFYCSLAHSIVLAPGYSLDTLFVRMDKSAAGLTLQGHAAMTIAEVALLLAAEGRGAGWRFSGRTLPGAAIPVGTLIEDAAQKFGATAAVPDVLRDLVLTDLSVSYDTASGGFSAGGGFAAPAGGAPTIGDLLAPHGVDAGTLPKTLPATACSFGYDPAEKRATVGVALSGGWAIGPLTIDGLSVLLTKQGDAVSAAVAGGFHLGSVAMTATMTYAAGAWTVVAGAVAGPDGIPLGALIDGMAADIGLSVPGFLRGVTLDDFSLTYASADRRTHVVVAGGLAIGPGVRVRLNLNRVEGQPLDIDGTLSVGTLDLDVREKAGAMTAEWHAANGGALALTDLAKAFGFDLPAAAETFPVKITGVSVDYSPAAGGAG